MEELKNKYRNSRNAVRFYLSVNWIKTVYFNFKMFPFKMACKLPVCFYGKVKFHLLSGRVEIKEAPVKFAMIGFGQAYESITRSKGTAELNLEGKIVFKGHVQFGKDYTVHLAPGSYLEMGHLSSLGNSGKILCYQSIVLGDYARIGFESQLMDSNFHQMVDTRTGERFPINGAIRLGNYNYVGNRVSIMQQTVTPDFCTIASSSLTNRDFSPYGANILIGGVPARLLKEYIKRDWEAEKEALNRWLIVG